MKHNRIGLDVGSTTLKVVVLDDHDNICFSTYVRHNARIRETLSVVFSELGERFGDELFSLTITGSVGLGIAERTQIPFVQEVVASTAYVRRYHPQATTLIDIGGEDDIAEGLPVLRAKGAKAWLSIMYGCNNFCTYCIVPYVRGREKSRKPGDILAEFRSLVEAGYKEITLLGQNVNSYGKGLEEQIDFSDLLNLLCTVPGDYHIRFMTSHPKDASHKLIDTIAAQPKLCKHLHLPVQCGSDELLKRMNRHYTAAEYESIVNNIRGVFDNPSVTTDMMVGFAGETPEDFEESLNFARKIGFAKVHVFAYSRRPGTAADRMPGQVPNKVKEERSRQLIEATNEARRRFLLTQVGRTEPVLFESKRLEDYYEGYTANYTPVHVQSPIPLFGKILPVKILEAGEDFCFGSLI